MARRLGVDIYFTDAYSSWQKGAVENTNKLIRQYIPKGTDISTVTDKRIKMIQAKINRRHHEIILKMYLIENKEVTSLHKLNR